LQAKLTALEEELRSKSNQLQSALNKIGRLEESHRSETDQLNIDIQHFRTLYKDLDKVVKSQEKY
jgi:uncharacterized protein YukE